MKLCSGTGILHATGDQAGARQLMDKLARSQDAAGGVKGGVTSITRGGNAQKPSSGSVFFIRSLTVGGYACPGF